MNRGPAIRLRSVNANYHVLMSTFSASRALQVLAFTFQGGFDSHPRLQILSCTKNSGAPGIPARPPNRLGGQDASRSTIMIQHSLLNPRAHRLGLRVEFENVFAHLASPPPTVCSR